MKPTVLDESAFTSPGAPTCTPMLIKKIVSHPIFNLSSQSKEHHTALCNATLGSLLSALAPFGTTQGRERCKLPPQLTCRTLPCPALKTFRYHTESHAHCQFQMHSTITWAYRDKWNAPACIPAVQEAKPSYWACLHER